MSDKKQTTVKQKPEHEIACGSVTASFYRRQSNSGYRYWDFGCTRHWHSRATGKKAFGTTFFHENEADLLEAITKACAWIRAKVAKPDPDKSPLGEQEGAS